MPLTPKQLRAASWVLKFKHRGEQMEIKTYASKEIDNVSITHEKKPGRSTRITYRVFGRDTNSPSQACRIYNEEEKRSRRQTAASIEPPPI